MDREQLQESVQIGVAELGQEIPAAAVERLAG